MQSLKENFSGTAPSNIHKKLVGNSNVANIYQGVLNPKNAKQVMNHKYIARQSKRIIYDNIYNLLILAYKLGTILILEICPDLVRIVGNTDMMEELHLLYLH